MYGCHDSSRENYNWQGTHWTAAGSVVQQQLAPKGCLQLYNDRIGRRNRGQE